MKIKATDKLLTFRASVLAEQFALEIKEIKKLKSGGIIDLEDDLLQKMITAGLIEPVEIGKVISSENSNTEDF